MNLDPLIIVWMVEMVLCAVFSAWNLRCAVANQAFMATTPIAHRARYTKGTKYQVILQGIISVKSLLLLAVGVVALVTPPPIRREVQTAQHISTALFEIYGLLVLAVSYITHRQYHDLQAAALEEVMEEIDRGGAP